jgi:hypothetical protein
MSQGRTTFSDPEAEMPALGGAVHPLVDGQVTLAQSLGPSIDQIRQIATDLGVRPYRVFLVHWLWPKQKGIGRPREIYRKEILPTPRVMDMAATPFAMTSFGLNDVGGLFVDQISAKYSEADLIGRTPDVMDPARPQTNLSNSECFWEVREARQTNPPTKPRRYATNGVPMLNRSGMQWKVNLVKQDNTAENVEPEVAS